MGGRENIRKYRNRINCKNIHLVLGNHDVLLAKNFIYSDGLNVQDLFNTVNIRINKKIGKDHFIMDHYAMRTWDRAHYGSIMLHGHSHDNLIPYEKFLQIADDNTLFKTGDFYKQMDVGLESAVFLKGEWRPFHINEIREIMQNKNNL